MNPIDSLVAKRLGGRHFFHNNKGFKFELIKQAKRDAVKQHPELQLIDLGIGEPDSIADIQIIEELYSNAKLSENRGYADNGIDEFKQAAASYMEMVYHVHHINPSTEVLHVIGSKSAYAILPQGFINPGDITLLTIPGYPILGTMTEWLGGEVYHLPLTESNHFLPDYAKIPSYILKRTKLLYLNYPNNPTGAIATADFFAKTIQFARDHHLIVIHDAAYASLTFNGTKPLSFLSVPGAKEVGIEVHSLSKAFNMTGWRLGFVVGNPRVIKVLSAVKDNNDSGQFKAIQKAGIYALSHPELTQKNVIKYERRHKKLCEALQKIGFHVTKPNATFYLYAKIPKGISNGRTFASAEEFSQFLIRNLLISSVPWDDVGSFVRFSVTFMADTIDEEDAIISEITKRLESCQFIF